MIDEIQINNNLVVYEDVYKAIELIPKEEEKAAAALALLRYGCGGIEYNGDNIFIKMILQQAHVGIDIAKEKYHKSIENGKKGGRIKQYDDNKIIELKEQGLTNKEVAKIIGCSEKTVERANVAHRQNRQTTDTDRQNLNINNNINNNINKQYKEKDSVFFEKKDTNSVPQKEEKKKTNLNDKSKQLIKIMENDYINDKFDSFCKGVYELMYDYLVNDKAMYTEPTDELYEYVIDTYQQIYDTDELPQLK